jgi:hypothetical protein
MKYIAVVKEIAISAEWRNKQKILTQIFRTTILLYKNDIFINIS